MAHPRPRARRAAPLIVGAAVAVAIVAVTALASGRAHRWTVAAPHGALTATVIDRGGAYALTVTRQGRRVLQTPLGRADGRDLHTTNATMDEAYRTPAGKRRDHRLVARRLTLAFGHGRRIDVLVADDGVAVRQAGAGHETTAWRAPASARAGVQEYPGGDGGGHNRAAGPPRQAHPDAVPA